MTMSSNTQHHDFIDIEPFAHLYSDKKNTVPVCGVMWHFSLFDW